jgi:tetratricopeptide (TPR) repeat protein
VAAQGSGGALADATFTLGPRLANAVVSYARYVQLTVLPVGLSIFYRHRLDLPGWEVAVAAVVLAALTAGALALARRTLAPLAGWLWFLGTLVPVIGIVQVGSQAMADRYTYLPLVGLFIAAVWAVDTLVQGPGRRLLPGVAVGATLALAVVAWVRVGDWRSNEALFDAALRVDPANGTAHEALAEGYREAGRMDLALLHLRAATQLEPGEVKHWTNLGAVALDLGLNEESLAALQQAVRTDPSHLSAWLNLSVVLERTGRMGEAAGALEEAARIAPGRVATWRRLAAVRYRLGDLGGAAQAAAVAERLGSPR